MSVYVTRSFLKNIYIYNAVIVDLFAYELMVPINTTCSWNHHVSVEYAHEITKIKK